MRFAEAAMNEAKWTRTENGAVALNTSGSACLDLFGTIGSLREADETRICRLFSDAYNEDALTATKIAFYARDIRGGLGERRTFRTLIRYMAIYHPEAIRPNICLIGEYGRYDDLYSLIGTPLEDEMWQFMRYQFAEDRKQLENGKPVSLLAKWIKTPDASSEKTRKLGILTAQKLGYPVRNFKRMLRNLRKAICVVECQMTANKWGEIKYPAVPSKAMHNYGKAFARHDKIRFNDFINKAVNGEVKINSSVLYPYELIEKVNPNGCHSYRSLNENPVIEAQWRALPNYVKEGTNVLVIADTSGSMWGRPMATSVGLAIYFAERNTGEFHNMWMSFNSSSTIHYIKGETLVQKIASLNYSDWGGSTNLERAFEHVLEIGVRNHIDPKDMPKSLIVISDMEIDYCGSESWTFYDKMESLYHTNGYEIPNVVFWNVNSRHDIFHADKDRKGVQLCSGQSVTVFRQLLESIGMNPVEMMFKTINSDRYSLITVESI